eukprot:1150620-Pelagomonas_calceolata.AAC.7
MTLGPIPQLKIAANMTLGPLPHFASTAVPTTTRVQQQYPSFPCSSTLLDSLSGGTIDLHSLADTTHEAGQTTSRLGVHMHTLARSQTYSYP